MFGTLVVELPSDGYAGAELKIWSPLKSDEVSTFSFGSKDTAQKMKYVVRWLVVRVVIWLNRFESPGLLSFPCLPTPVIGTVARGLENHLQLTVAGTAPDFSC